MFIKSFLVSLDIIILLLPPTIPQALNFKIKSVAISFYTNFLSSYYSISICFLSVLQLLFMIIISSLSFSFSCLCSFLSFLFLNPIISLLNQIPLLLILESMKILQTLLTLIYFKIDKSAILLLIMVFYNLQHSSMIIQSKPVTLCNESRVLK